MGIQTYFMEIVRDENGVSPEKFKFTTTGIDSFSGIEYFGERLKAGRYFNSFSCREFLYVSLNGVNKTLFAENKAKNIMIGVRMIGEMHTKVTAVLESQGDSTYVLENFMRKNFKVKALLRFGRAEPNWVGTRFSGDIETRILKENHMGYTTVPRNGYVDLYICPGDNANLREGSLAVMVTGLLWLFREPVIIRKILSREIQNNTDLADALVSLAVDRYNGIDKSFIVASTYGNPCCYSPKDLQERWLGVHKSSVNSSATDYVSMFCAGLFFFTLNKPTLAIPQSTKRNVSGFVQAMRWSRGYTNRVLKYLIKSLKKRGGNVATENIKYILSRNYGTPERQVYEEVFGE